MVASIRVAFHDLQLKIIFELYYSEALVQPLFSYFLLSLHFLLIGSSTKTKFGIEGGRGFLI